MNDKNKIDVMLLTTIGITLVLLLLSGCAIKQPGTRTISYGDDGITVTSETTSGASTELADLEKEKTRQVCFKAMKDKKDKMLEAVKENPLVLVMLEQAQTINNALSLMKTGKNYDPCPSSTNSANVEIADAEMYKSIYHDAFDFGKTVAGIWGIVEVSSNLADALTSASAGTTYLNSGSGDINLTNSGNTTAIGGASTGDLFSMPTTETVAAPVVAE